MAHIDYEQVASLDALVGVSDAAARATLVRLRERLAALDPNLDERVVYDGLHRKPALALYRGHDALLHVYPEPNIAVGLHVVLPLRASDRRLLDLGGLSDKMREAVLRARPRHNTVWVEMILHTPSDADELAALLERRLDLVPRAPTVH